MAKNIDSIKHSKDKRVHIPSKEEAGYEDASKTVQEGKKILELPKNPVVHRGQDPELFWLNKYGNDDRDDLLRVDIRSLYRHEHIAPETLIKKLYTVTEKKSAQEGFFSVNELFGNALDKDELEKVSEYYRHSDGWTNRLIQGDSHLVMASLLEREGMAGQVQMIYIDPPYGIKYGSNWQVKLNNRDVKDGSDDSLAGEPEVIKAFRDTWELGIHSYLSYLRDRLLVAKELLTENGSCFVQISDENVHLVRSIMDEVFGSENYCSLIVIKKTSAQTTEIIPTVSDYVIWYSKDRGSLKFRPAFKDRSEIMLDVRYNNCEFEDGTIKKFNYLTEEDLRESFKRFKTTPLTSQTGSDNSRFPYEFNGEKYVPTTSRGWSTSKEGLDILKKKNRLIVEGQALYYKRYIDDFPVETHTNIWEDLGGGAMVHEKVYVVQTSRKVIERCLLMTTDPGDLVLDPTCGSGTTAYVAEQFGRRWITLDTSRIALNIAKQRLTTAVYPYYTLYDEQSRDIRQGFIYKTVPHITLKSLANNEPAATETLYDQPEVDKKILRVSGSFTVETLQNFEPVSPEELSEEHLIHEEAGEWTEKIKQHLLSTGIKNGRKDERVQFSRIELLADAYLHAEGFYQTKKGEQKAYFHIGPKFGTVSKDAVNKAVKECQLRGNAAWLVILGFSFESDIENTTQTISLGTFEVTKARIHDDLLQEGLKKKPSKSAASFITIGEPDIDVKKKGKELTVEIRGLDIYDPIKDEVKARNVSDIAYWMVDDNYDGSNFVVKQIFFCGGDKDEFEKWKKGLSEVAKHETKRKAEKTLKIEIDDEAFDRLYGHISHPIEIKNKGQKIAVRVISQFGEETTKVITV